MVRSLNSMRTHVALQRSGASCERIGRMGRVSDPSPQAADLDAESGSPEPPLHQALGLTDDEFAQIGELLGRQPNHLELAMYSVMWSEHCSYKSSRVHLGRFPTEAPWVLVGPGENAGVVDVGDGIAVALRIESHNHPSAIEPYQGAATGIGGIVRDIFTMGARPIALMDPLRFGPLDDPRSRWVAEGVVSGISGYGNSVGVPTVGGEVVFDACYQGNPLVNALCAGVMRVEARQEPGWYGLIHSHYWQSGWAGTLLARELDLPHVVMFHTLGEVKNRARFGEEEPKLRIRHERTIARRATAIVTGTIEPPVFSHRARAWAMPGPVFPR